MTIRHIAVLSGKRGGYGAMFPMLRAIQDDPGLRLSLIVTDQHLNQRFGNTVDEVTRDFPVVTPIDLGQTGGSPRERTRALGTGLTKMADVFADLAPDLLVLYGDRGESVIAAVAAINLGIPIAHIQGGDVSGNVDEPVRHAITKLAHLHFPSNEESAARISAMGEEDWRIRVVGDNHVDPIVAGTYTSAAVVRRRYDVPEGARPFILIYHPETTSHRDGHADMRRILETVLAGGRRTIIIYPCSDQGYEEILRAIGEVEGGPNVSVHKNIEAPDFHGLLAIAAALIGNSSAGLIETPYLGIPAINIGGRQKGRRHAENVIHCGHDADEIAAALAMVVGDGAFAERVATCSRPFGDGMAYQRIVDALRTVPLDNRLKEKRFAA